VHGRERWQWRQRAADHTAEGGGEWGYLRFSYALSICFAARPTRWLLGSKMIRLPG
jgi:hypothetical protein